MLGLVVARGWVFRALGPIFEALGWIEALSLSWLVYTLGLVLEALGQIFEALAQG